MCERSEEFRAVGKVAVERNFVPVKYFDWIQVINCGERIELVRTWDRSFVFDGGQPADVDDKVTSPTNRRQLVTGAFDITKRQTEFLPRLAEPRPGKHDVLKFRWDGIRQSLSDY